VLAPPAEPPAVVPYGPVTVTVYPPPQASQPGSPPVQSSYPAVTVVPQQQAVPNPENLPPLVSGARLIPAMDPQPGKQYKLQVGSYKIARNAVDAFTKLQKSGLNPDYERFGDFYRVVLKGIRGSDVQAVAEKLEQAGFSEAIIKEE